MYSSGGDRLSAKEKPSNTPIIFMKECYYYNDGNCLKRDSSIGFCNPFAYSDCPYYPYHLLDLGKKVNSSAQKKLGGVA